jgi:hypothetical protein
MHVPGCTLSLEQVSFTRRNCADDVKTAMSVYGMRNVNSLTGISNFSWKPWRTIIKTSSNGKVMFFYFFFGLTHSLFAADLLQNSESNLISGDQQVSQSRSENITPNSVNDMTDLKQLNAHPRLYASRQQLERLRAVTDHPLLTKAVEKVSKDAVEFLKGETFEYDKGTHNAHLIRARIMQGRIVTLLVEHFRTGDVRYRDAVIRHVEEMDRWTHWSWIAERQSKNDPKDIFDLSYGENSTTLAIAYDWLHASLNDEQRKRFVDIARRRSFVPFLYNTEKKTEEKNRSWWFGKPDTNWNTVCAGGAGMLALAMYEEAPEAIEVIKRAEISIGSYMRHLTATSGAWPEGIGYWNYGMRYGYMYILSHEKATNREHPLMQLPEAQSTLSFPIHFCPKGIPCSFGDVNRWSPLPFHYAAAERFKRDDLVALLDSFFNPATDADDTWPNDAEMLVLHPRTAKKILEKPITTPYAQLYQGLDWGILADRWPDPNLYVSVRGGSTKVPHTHLDLMSFHLIFGGQKMVHNLGVDEYLDTTFGPRRFDLFETSAPSKNTILINGVGITQESEVATELIKSGDIQGIRIEATEAFGKSRDGNAASFGGRLFVLLNRDTILIIDRIETKFPARMETRFHTYAQSEIRKDSAQLVSQDVKMNVIFASNVPSVLTSAQDALTTPGKVPTVVRWCTQGRDLTAVTFVTMFTKTTASNPTITFKAGALTVRQDGDSKAVVTDQLRFE